MKKSSLSVLLLVWILPVSLGALFLSGVAAYYAARHQILQDVQKEVDTLGETIAAQAGGFFAQRNNDVATIAQSPLFKDHYKNLEYGLHQEAEGYRREIELMLLGFSIRTQTYPRLRYVDAHGRELCRILDDKIRPTRRGIEDGETFRSVQTLKAGQRYISGIMRVPWHAYPIVRYGAPLFDEGGKLAGAILFDCSLSPVYRLLERSRLGSSGRSFLVDRAGSPADLSPPQMEANSLIASSAVEGTPWTVRMVVDRGEFLAGLDRIRNVSVILFVFLSLILTCAVCGRVRSATGPIQRLAQAAETYAQGNLAVRVPITEPREVALLAVAFNDMADRLQQRTEDLEKRVRELTALQRMNDAVMRRLGRREIGRTCLEAAITGLGFEAGALYWVHEDRGEIVGECFFGTRGVALTDDVIRRRRIAIASSNILAHVARTREAVIIEDAGKDPRCDPAHMKESQLQSFCLAPILGRNNRVIGIIGADYHFSRETVRPQEVERLSLFCSVAGLALENAQLLEAILDSETRYRTAVDNSPDAVVALDQHYRITLWNRRAEALFGHQPTEAFGRTLEFLLEPKDYQGLLRQVETEGAVRHREAVGVARDGRRLDIIVSWTGRHGEHGQAREWFVVIQDVTEKKQLQAQLIQAEKLSAAGTLLAGIAHELNNPLSAVTGFSEILIERADLPPEDKDDLRLIYTSAFRCRDIVRGLLAFARQQPSERRRVPLNRVAHETLALVEYQMKKRDAIHLELDLSPDAPAVAGEFQKIQQVLVNLIVNACDAVKDRGPRGVIRIQTRAYPERVEVLVEDNGPGIAPEIRPRVFDPFFTTKSPGKGTGLGLSISSQIVAEAGGILRCERSSLGGARFAASFPPCPETVPESEVLTQLPPPIGGCRALVVDDEPNVAKVMLRILRDDGIEAVAATRFEDARRMIQEGGFDLVVADVGLENSKGTDLVGAADPAKQPPAFLFVSGDVLNPSLHEEIARLQAPFLAKPFLRTEFLRMVRTILLKSKAAKR